VWSSFRPSNTGMLTIYVAIRARKLFARDEQGCVKCQEGVLGCDPDCTRENGRDCKQIVPLDCTQCPKTKCVELTESPAAGQAQAAAGASTPNNKPNVGVIAGATVGGILMIAAATYLFWRFCIKSKRQPTPTESYDEIAVEKADAPKSFQDRRDQRSSMHTVHSVASTVLTRASNIIQIAYIPGVTNRATPTSPTVLVPPVPPIPITVTDGNSPSPYEDQHFFMPGDLRGSTYSGMSGYTDRTSYARTSYAPRSSVASTIYGKNAVIVATPQTGMRAKPAVVSVRSAGASSGPSTPPVPSVDYEKYSRPRSRDSTFSVGSTFLNNASAATAIQGKGQVIRVGSGGKKSAKQAGKETSGDIPPIPSSPSIARDSTAATIIEDVPAEQGPFSDPPSRLAHRSTTSLSAVIEESTRRSTQVDKTKRVSRETSPFGDEHATKD
jgi:hypothetical protein